MQLDRHENHAAPSAISKSISAMYEDFQDLHSWDLITVTM